jgi:hypothetical protein
MRIPGAWTRDVVVNTNKKARQRTRTVHVLTWKNVVCCSCLHMRCANIYIISCALAKLHFLYSRLSAACL